MRLKSFIKCYLSFLVLFSHLSFAFPITEKDAFVTGDKLAFQQESNGLEWLDLTAVTAVNLDELQQQLQTTYLGWRLPTQAEVLGLFSDIFPMVFDEAYDFMHLNMTLHTDQITTRSFFPDIEAAFNIMVSDNPIQYSDRGTQYRRILNSYIDDSGSLVKSAITLYTNLYYCPLPYCDPSIAYYYETEAFATPVSRSGDPAFGSFYLVKNVPEPNGALMILFGLIITMLISGQKRVRSE